jgi:GT2 family glycosyltransferase
LANHREGELNGVHSGVDEVSMTTTATVRPRLSWALMICTYNRPDMLQRCVRLALRQTRPPEQIVIVDASAEWEPSARAIAEVIATEHPGLPFVYEPAKVRSITHQRNQALPKVTSDVVFAIDDHSLMDQTCAEAVMRVYEADPDEQIAGVGTTTIDTPPDEASTEPRREQEADAPAVNPFRQWLERQLHMDRQFVPYRAGDSLEEKAVYVNGERRISVGVLNGFRITFRRKYGAKVGWCEALRYYGLHEDADFSYRLSRLGLVVIASDAQLCHCQAPGGRLSRDVVGKLRVLNLVALHKTYSEDLQSSALRILGSYLRFAGVYLVIDPARKRYTLPTVRAYLYGISTIPAMLLRSGSSFEGTFQNTVESLVTKR